MVAHIPFLAFVSDDASLAEAKKFAESKKGEAHKGDIESAIVHLKNAPSSGILLVEIKDEKKAPEAFDRLADVCEPGTKVIVVSDINTYSFYVWLREIGIAHYLLKPLAPEKLGEAYDSLTKVEEAPVATSSETDAKKSSIIVVLGTRGGVGASTIAANLAGVIAEQKEPTVVIDLDPQQGTIALGMDLDPGRGLREALEKPERIDGLFLERVMVKHGPHLSVMSTEEALDDVVQYNPAAAERLLEETQKKCRHIIVDLPRNLHGLSREILKRADCVILVTDLTIASLRDCLRLNDFFRDTLKIKPPRVVANRVGLAGKFEMPQSEFEKGLGTKLAAILPFDTAWFGASSRGELLVDTQSASPILKMLQQIATQCQAYKAVKKAPAGQAKKRGFGWLSKA